MTPCGSDLLVRAYLRELPFMVNSRQWATFSREDREDLAQRAVMELLGHEFASELHARNALAQRFKMRAIDLHRSRSGRSRDAIHHCDEAELPERGTLVGPDCIVIARETLRSLLSAANPDEIDRIHRAGSLDAKRKRLHRARTRLRAAA